MNWTILGRYRNQEDLVNAANRASVGAGGLVVCLANKAEYVAWITTDARSEKTGSWQHFHVEDDAMVASELNRIGVPPGAATVTVNGKNSQYIVFYYA